MSEPFMWLLGLLIFCFSFMFCCFLDYCKEGINHWLSAKSQGKREYWDGYERGYTDGVEATKKLFRRAEND